MWAQAGVLCHAPTPEEIQQLDCGTAVLSGRWGVFAHGLRGGREGASCAALDRPSIHQGGNFHLVSEEELLG